MAPYWVLGALIIGFGLALFSAKVLADPIGKAEAEGAVITFYNEPCLIKDQITNLPFRAEWVEKDKTYQGCFGIRPDIGMVVAWFDDRTVALIPLQAVKKVTGA